MLRFSGTYSCVHTGEVAGSDPMSLTLFLGVTDPCTKLRISRSVEVFLQPKIAWRSNRYEFQNLGSDNRI